MYHNATFKIKTCINFHNTIYSRNNFIAGTLKIFRLISAMFQKDPTKQIVVFISD